MPPNIPNHENGWNRHEEFVLRELERIAKAVEELRTDLAEFRLEFVASTGERRGSAKAWGAVSGFLTAVAVYVIGHFIVPLFTGVKK